MAMNKGLKITLILLGTGITGFAGYMLYKKVIKPKLDKKKGLTSGGEETDTSQEESKGKSSSSSSSSSSSKRSGFPLDVGSRGNQVKNVQAYLNSTTGGYNLDVDGIYGKKTADALKRWNGKEEVSKGYYEWIKTQPSSKY